MMMNSNYITPLLLLFVSVSFSNTTPVSIQENNTMTNYRQLLSIELKHSYFHDGKFTGFHAEPNQETSRFLQEFDLKMVTRENVIKVFAPETTSLAGLIESGNTLQFDIVFQDSYFYNYTELPMHELGVVLFKNDSAADDSALLSATYQTTADPSKAVGRISIYLPNLRNRANQEPFAYIAQFTARAVAVKYIIIARPPITQLKLKGDDAALFSGPYPYVMPDGTNAQVFDSGTNLFPLSETHRVERTIEFLSNGTPNAALTLPTPSPERLLMEVDRIVVQVYVYL